MKVLFVGHFAPMALQSWQREVGSIPGNQVQREIIDALRANESVKGLEVLSLRPIASWPKDRLFIRGAQESDTYFTPFINLPVIKNLIFAFLIFLITVRTRPSVLVTYNSYLIENIAILAYSNLARNIRSAIVIQDINTSSGSLRGLVRAFYERLGLGLTKFFSLVVPVSRRIVDDFGLSGTRYRVFPGGMTAAADAVSSRADLPEDFAVFAGALTTYNCIDILAKEWARQQVPYDLHVFGRGPLDAEIQALAKVCDKIHVHGFVPEEDVTPWLARAQWTFCLRMSRGLDQGYFFPSKFFTLACAPGAVVTNASFDAPPDLKDLTHVIPDDAKDLIRHLLLARKNSTPRAVADRRSSIRAKYTWKREIGFILHALEAS